MSMQSLDIKRLSATTTTPPQVCEPRSGEIAKLIDVSKCIGCKACQSACMEWNDLRPDIVETPFGIWISPTPRRLMTPSAVRRSTALHACQLCTLSAIAQKRR